MEPIRRTSRRVRLEVETLEQRDTPSTLPLLIYGDFNNDGRLDTVDMSSSTTVTVRLANSDGSYTESAVLSVPQNQQIASINVYDYDADGNLDISVTYFKAKGLSTQTWLGNGDGTFDLSTGKDPRGGGRHAQIAYCFAAGTA